LGGKIGAGLFVPKLFANEESDYSFEDPLSPNWRIENNRKVNIREQAGLRKSSPSASWRIGDFRDFLATIHPHRNGEVFWWETNKKRLSTDL